MIKKAISYLVIISFLSYMGCSRTIQVTKYEFNKEHMEEKDKREIYITTIDSTRYSFTKNSYLILNDTLYGKGQRIDIHGNESSFYGKITFKDIEFFEGTEVDTELLVILIVFGISIVGFIVNAILTSDLTGF